MEDLLPLLLLRRNVYHFKLWVFVCALSWRFFRKT